MSLDKTSEPQMTTSTSASPSPLPEAEFQEYIAKYPFAAEPTYFTRPNRYYGPASTWRSWTANDRAVADAHDKIRAQDLSAHLYNAFALKQAAGQTAVSKRVRPRSRSRNKAVVADAEDASEINGTFVPPEVWTAWPLRGDRVPREEPLNEFDGRPVKGKIDTRPSARLEEALIATMLRLAKEKWESRKQATPPPDVSKRDWKKEQSITTEQLTKAGLLEDPTSDDQALDEDNRSMHSPTDLSEPYETEDDDAQLSDDNLPNDIPTFSSQAFALGDKSPTTSDTESVRSTTDTEDDRPVFMADDERARQILLPSTRHILSKLDDLLTGLHRARQTYAVHDADAISRSRSRSAFTDAESTDDENFIRTGSRAESKKRGRKRKRSTSSPSPARSGPRSARGNSNSDEVDEFEEELDPLPRSRPQSRSQTRNRPQSRVRRYGTKGLGLGLRDWSDILGMAALTGWNPETVARASERCARIFNQNIMFRTMHQPLNNGKEEKPVVEETYAYVRQAEKVDLTEAGDEGLPAKEVNHVHGDEELKAEVEFVRVSSACTRCRLQSLRCQPQLPSATSDTDLSKPQPCASCTTVRGLNTPCSGIMIQPRSKSSLSEQISTSKLKVCPYLDCPRHNPSKPFKKRSHLDRHTKDVHVARYATSETILSSSHPTIVPNDLGLSLRQTSRHGDAIKEGGMVCPVMSCEQHRHVYTRMTRLYDHIRSAHPQFNLGEWKRVHSKARVGKRGRYDRSRVRKASQSQLQSRAREEGGERDQDQGDGDGEGEAEGAIAIDGQDADRNEDDNNDNDQDGDDDLDMPEVGAADNDIKGSEYRD